MNGGRPGRADLWVSLMYNAPCISRVMRVQSSSVVGVPDLPISDRTVDEGRPLLWESRRVTGLR